MSNLSNATKLHDPSSNFAYITPLRTFKVHEMERHRHHVHHKHHHHNAKTTPGSSSTIFNQTSYHFTTPINAASNNMDQATEATNREHQGHHHHGDIHAHEHTSHNGHAMAGAIDSEMHHRMSHQHEPAFRWFKDVSILFEQWTTSTVWEVLIAMLVAALLAIVYEVLRNFLSTWDNTSHGMERMSKWRRMFYRVSRSGMHALNATVGYLQMLFAMTCDLRIFIAIIIGAGVGYFFLGPYFRRKMKTTKFVCPKRTSNTETQAFLNNNGTQTNHKISSLSHPGESIEENDLCKLGDLRETTI